MHYCLGFFSSEENLEHGKLVVRIQLTVYINFETVVHGKFQRKKENRGDRFVDIVL